MRYMKRFPVLVLVLVAGLVVFIGSGVAIRGAPASIDPTTTDMARKMSKGEAAGIEPKAAQILRGMTDYMAGLQQFSAQTESTVEVVLTSGQKVQVPQLGDPLPVASQQDAGRPGG